MVPNAADILKKHWDTWVSLADFQKIAKAGFNTVRIPVGCKDAYKYCRRRKDRTDMIQTGRIRRWTANPTSKARRLT